MAQPPPRVHAEKLLVVWKCMPGMILCSNLDVGRRVSPVPGAARPAVVRRRAAWRTHWLACVGGVRGAGDGACISERVPALQEVGTGAWPRRPLRSSLKWGQGRPWIQGIVGQGGPLDIGPSEQAPGYQILRIAGGQARLHCIVGMAGAGMTGYTQGGGAARRN